VTTSCLFVFAAAQASISLHGDTVRRVLYAPISWYDATPSGRIIGRLATDMSIVDNKHATHAAERVLFAHRPSVALVDAHIHTQMLVSSLRPLALSLRAAGDLPRLRVAECRRSLAVVCCVFARRLAQDVDVWIQMLGPTIVLTLYIVAISPGLVGVVFVVLIVFVCVTFLADTAVREVRRIETSAVAPILSTLSECRTGAPIIRCMNFFAFFDERQAKNTEAWGNASFMAKGVR
jgi:ABC-type multidrug transport system fused ATPase/permease subunit